MKSTLLSITVLGLAAALAFATPGRDLNKRRVEKKRDARKTEVTAPATVKPAAQSGSHAPAPPSTSAPAPGQGAAPAARPAAAKPASAPAPAGPSHLVRDGKPPSHRFFSRVRTDASREAAKAKLHVSQINAPATTDGKAKNLIYRRTWGTPSRHRPR